MNSNTQLGHNLSMEIDSFLLDRKARNLSKNTISYYIQELRVFSIHCERNNISLIEEINPDLLRSCILELSQKRTGGGVYAFWRALRAFLFWFEQEEIIDYWKNPLRKVKAPKVYQDPLPGVSIQTIKLLLGECKDDFYGIRNRSILLFLFDTGLRVSELCDLNLEDIDLDKKIVIVKHGKGNKARSAFIGKKCSMELIKYLELRPGITPENPIFSHKTGKRFTREGIESMIDGLAKSAKITPPSPHDFRRAFTKETLKHTDVLTVARLLGHSDTSLVWKYYYQNIEDLQKAHEAASPVDNLRL